ncbi:MAG: carbohydrate porin [Myxococcales bacterium]|nr:carbohydrate porin [Myxococcales bacterium]
MKRRSSRLWRACTTGLFGYAVLAPLGTALAQTQTADEEAASVVSPAPALPGNGVRGEFQFGSYGRVVVASDLDGGAGKEVNVVSFGPRLKESPYLELDLAYALRTNTDAEFRTVVTAALVNAMFHYDGDFDGQIALRNAFVEASGFGVEGLSFWAGSRMYRGDDIYLLNFWPMDNLNTVGGGTRYAFTPDMSLAVHFGANRLDNRLQFQNVAVPAPTFGTENRILNDRLRPIVSARWEHLFHELAPGVGIKYVVWGDFQRLGEGVTRDNNDVEIELPADTGYTLGAQVGAWGFTPNGFANLFVRYSRGLAVAGELNIPTAGLATDRTYASASLVRLGTSFNAESRWIGVTGGAYMQWFSDADDVNYDRDDYAEGVFAVRPAIFITDHFHQAFEISYQRRVPEGLSPRTDSYLEPAILQFGFMPTLSLGRGMYRRPVLRLIYAASLLNAGARDLFPEGDPRHEASTQHFLGLGAEWWFNSSTYR